MENYKYSQKKKKKKKSTKSSLCWRQAVSKSNRVSRYFHSTLMSLDAWNTLPDAQQDNATVLTILTASIRLDRNPDEPVGCI